MRLTINDIAEMAKVSRSTVSRVVTNHPNVNSKTREKILRIIKNNRYEPNSIARGFAKGQIPIISLIVSDIRNPVFAELTWEIQKNLQSYAYDVMLFNSDSVPLKEQKFLNFANANRFAGIILFSANYPENDTIHLDVSNCPIILINRDTNNPDIDTIRTDNFHGGYIATRHLIELGHKKIGLLSGSLLMASHRDRFAGHRKALEEFGLPYYPEYTEIRDIRSAESGAAYARRLLQRGKEGPSAVFATGDMMAFGLLDEYRRSGGRVPEDVSIIGFDDIFYSAFSGIDLTTIHQPFRNIAKEATKLLMAKIAGESESAQSITLATELIVRSTTGPHKAR